MALPSFKKKKKQAKRNGYSINQLLEKIDYECAFKLFHSLLFVINFRLESNNKILINIL